jgi:hypothetical protein
METSSDEKELVAVNQLKLHVNLMIVHPAIEDELIPGRAPKSEVRRPVLVAPLREGESCVRDTDRGPIISERIVRPLKQPQVHQAESKGKPAGST